jgi:hypothetical protein
MNRLEDLWEAAVEAFQFCVWLIAITLWVAVYGPITVLAFSFLFYLVWIYFQTLVQSPSLIHLYLGLVFLGVLIYRLWFWKLPDDFEMRRGREIRLDESTDRANRRRSRTSRVDRSRTPIRRGRQP